MHLRVALLVVVFFAGVSSCKSDDVGGSDAGLASSSPSSSSVPRRASKPPVPAPPDMPNPEACAADADCVVVQESAPDTSSPCCDTSMTRSLARGFVTWIGRFRTERCEGVACPPLPLPGARMAECGYQPRCLNGRCGNACATSP